MVSQILVLFASVTPLFVSHNDVVGDVQTMTNISAWSSSIIEDIHGSTNGLLEAAYTYTDDASNNVLTAAYTYTDTASNNVLTAARSYTDTASNNVLTAARSYTDDASNNVLTAARSYTDTASNNVLTAAKSYTDKALVESKKRYALFIIPLSYYDDGWTGIELKASTNNFDTSHGDGIVFYSASVYNETVLSDPQLTFNFDWCRIFILTGQLFPDSRKWVRIKNTSESVISYYPNTLAILVDPSLFRSGHGTDWCYEGNENLIWSYVRFSDSSPEVESSIREDTQLWRPIMPVKWYNNLPNWANQNSYEQP